MLDKKSIRDRILGERDGKTSEWRVSASQTIAEHLTKLPIAAVNHPVAGYWPFGSEADPRPLMQALAGSALKLCLPVIRKHNLHYRHFAFGDELVPAGWGTFGPKPETGEVRPRTLLVPLAAFDATGARIGWGKGHYDRSIAALKADGQPLLTIGVAFSFQQVEQVPTEPHDAPLDFIVTELGVISRGSP